VRGSDRGCGVFFLSSRISELPFEPVPPFNQLRTVYDGAFALPALANWPIEFLVGGFKLTFVRRFHSNGFADVAPTEQSLNCHGRRVPRKLTRRCRYHGRLGPLPFRR